MCRAVAFAHQFGVIHRDIKPDNVVVTGGGAPKLIDFGVPRPLVAGSSDEPRANLTRTGQLPLTPEYASPEQVRGEPVRQASDVYSLGIVLYELLCGRGPYTFSRRSAAETERVVCSQESVRPSTRVREAVNRGEGDKHAAANASIADARSTSPEALSRTLRGELDNIVQMALRKEPERRCATAEHFAEDT